MTDTIQSQRKILMNSGIRLPKKINPPRTIEPKAIEREYFKAVKRLLKPVFVVVKERLLPKIKEISSKRKSEMKIDSAAEDISFIFKDVEIAVGIVMAENQIKQTVLPFAIRTSNFNKNQMDKQIKTVLGVNPLLSEPYLIPAVDAFVATNVNLIKSIPTQYLESMETLIRDRIEQGVSGDKIEQEILSTMRINKVEPSKSSATGFRKINPVNRARLITRDQIGKFHGKLSELRQQEVGIQKYKWSTSKDEKVRPRHSSHEGKTFSWKKPPITGSRGEKLHPGQDIQCRCVALPILDDFF